MIRQIETLVQFHSTKWHTPIALITHEREMLDWHEVGIAVYINAYPMSQFCKDLFGDPIVMSDVLVGKVSPTWLVLYGTPRPDVTSNILDQHLPRMCRGYRHQQRDALVESIASCVQDRRRELQASLREDNYELERLSLQVMQLSRKLESDRQVLRLFERSPDWLRNRSNHTFCDLMKLVPAMYAGFRIEDETIIGTTHSIDIENDGHVYSFGAYDVEVNMRQGKVCISGGTDVNGYVHPHVSDEKSNVCWGNVGHLVSRLAGELDLHGLLQLVHNFLSSYNPSDPFQKIEKWNPDWQDESDDDEPYCSWCDDYGHSIEDCDSCWFCEHCQQYDDHDEEDCPNAPKSEEEEDADAELAEDTTAAG